MTARRRRRRRPALALAALGPLALAGCEGGEPANPVKPIKMRSEYHEQLSALSEPMRRLAMMRAVRDTGNRCKKVEAAGYQEDHRNMPMWVARCSDSGAWAVFIAPNGDIQVRDCDDAATLDLPPCRVPAAVAGAAEDL